MKTSLQTRQEPYAGPSVGAVSKRAAIGPVSATIPPAVHYVLGSPGHPLDPVTRLFMESRFAHDFSQVRVHADGEAAESTEAVNALAYTVGRDMVFGKGQYRPHSSEGRQLLAHELAHTVQQESDERAPALESAPSASSEQEAAETASLVVRGGAVPPVHRAPAQLARQPKPGVTQAPTSTPSPASSPSAAPMKRTDFDRIMKDRYRVKTRTGTFQEQAFGEMKQEEWKAWDPGTSSTVYDWITDAFAGFERSFGGLPEVTEIVFFDSEYHRGSQGQVVKSTRIGASYALGRVTIYSGVQSANKMFNLKGVLESPTTQQSVTRNITHELGHGIAETALTQGTDQPPGAEPDLFKIYNPAVGWTREGRLYDIGERAVRDALARNTTPPAQFEITPQNVDTKPWKERPLTRYMADNPGDDFAETIMAYVNEPERLKSLSPARFKLIEKHKARWLASGQLKMNFWEQASRGGPARTLKPSRPPTIWERALEAK